MNPRTRKLLEIEHATMRAELLWRLEGIYDLQRKALPLIVALMLALSWGGAEKRVQSMPLIVGWLLIPMFFALAIKKIKHHRQRNRELAAYIMFIEMIVYDRFPQIVSNGQPGLEILIGFDSAGKPKHIELTAADLGWEHFIRTYRRLLPCIVDQLEADHAANKRLAREYRVKKTIKSMSEIELRFMRWFRAFAVGVAAFQITTIMFGMELWGRIGAHLVLAWSALPIH